VPEAEEIADLLPRSGADHASYLRARVVLKAGISSKMILKYSREPVWAAEERKLIQLRNEERERASGRNR